jgi:hypothetical protein
MQCAVLIRLTRDFLSRPQQDEASMMKIIRQIRQNSGSSPQQATEFDTQKASGLLLILWAMQIIHNRLLVALRPGLQSSAVQEEETQRLVQRILLWYAQMLLESPLSQPTFAVHIASVTRNSQQTWADAINSVSRYIDSKGSLKVAIFDQWRDTLFGPGAVKRCFRC